VTEQHFPKLERDGVITDSAAEIFVNKLCTLVERSEVRDLVDVMLLEKQGHQLEASLGRAQAPVSRDPAGWREPRSPAGLQARPRA